MGDYLPGTLQDRLKELREKHKLTQAQVARALGISQPSYGRIENGTIKEIGSDDLIALADFYDVPADYVLGRTNSPENTGYDIRELGLSVEAARNLYSRKVDPDVINELLTNDRFAVATAKMAAYFTNSYVVLEQSYNKINEMSQGLLEDMIAQQKLPDDEAISTLLERTRDRKNNSDVQAMTDIRKDVTDALKEIKKKVMGKLETKVRNREKLCGDIVEKVKAEVMSKPNLKDLPNEEKIAFANKVVTAELQLNPEISKEEAEIIRLAIEHILRAMADMNEEGAKG